jgi:hypothetical protein
MLHLDHLGKTVRTPVESLPPKSRPRSQAELDYRIPPTHKGVEPSAEVRAKLEAMRAGLPQFEWLPAAPPRLMPYLYSNDEFGNTAIRHGALIEVFPLEPAVQGAKTWLSSTGLRYSLQQSFTYSAMSEVVRGDSELGNYNLDFAGKWALFDLRGERGSAGWLSWQVEYQTPIGGAPSSQSVQRNIDSLTNPLGFRSSHSGWRVPELAWQQSFDAGRWVALAGVINQGNYLDVNSYTNKSPRSLRVVAPRPTRIAPARRG